MGERATGSGVEVRAAGRADIPEIVRVLTEAFAGDEVMSWIQPDQRARPDLLRGMFTATARHLHPPHEGTQVAVSGDGRVLGAAVWAPPGAWQGTTARLVRAAPGLLWALDRANLSSFAGRGKSVQDALDAAHPAEPHGYLTVLGVADGARGQGVGEALLTAGLARCRGAGLPAYLECLPRLEGYYGRFGFARRVEMSMPPGAPGQVGMWAPLQDRGEALDAS